MMTGGTMLVVQAALRADVPDDVYYRADKVILYEHVVKDRSGRVPRPATSADLAQVTKRY